MKLLGTLLIALGCCAIVVSAAAPVTDDDYFDDELETAGDFDLEIKDDIEPEKVTVAPKDRLPPVPPARQVPKVPRPICSTRTYWLTCCSSGSGSGPSSASGSGSDGAS